MDRLLILDQRDIAAVIQYIISCLKQLLSLYVSCLLPLLHVWASYFALKLHYFVIRCIFLWHGTFGSHIIYNNFHALCICTNFGLNFTDSG